MIGEDDFGEDPMYFPFWAVQLDELPEPGDVLCAPVPWYRAFYVEQVIVGEGLYVDEVVEGDPDEVALIWYDADVIVQYEPPSMDAVQRFRWLPEWPLPLPWQLGALG